MSDYIVPEFRYAPGSLSQWQPDERRTANPEKAVARDEICLSVLPPGPADAKFVVPSAFVDINLGPCPTHLAVNSDKRSFAIVPEDTFGFVTAGTELHLTSNNPVPCIVLEIGDHVLADWAEAAEITTADIGPFGGYRNDSTMGALGHLAASLLNDFGRSGTRPDVMMMESLVLGISARLLASLSRGVSVIDQAARGAGAADRRLSAGADYARAHLADPGLKVADMAAEAGISPHHFAERFRAWKGISPYAFVREERLKLAKRMLSMTKIPIAAIAHDTGFSSQSHLTTAFKEVYGVTPSRYRNGP
ncbi:MAG: helix-turn-helix transcriptional regulator [Pseudomonadota bacterium]